MSKAPNRPKRSRSRTRGGKAKGGAAGPPGIDHEAFWGRRESLPDRIDGLRHAPDVTVVVSSLGRPPLPGHETAAEHWFSLVYERAAFLAGALAAAGDLDGDEDDDV